MSTLTFETWKSKALGEYLRLTGHERHEAVMYFDHINDELRGMYGEGLSPLVAIRQCMFDDEHEC